MGLFGPPRFEWNRQWDNDLPRRRREWLDSLPNSLYPLQKMVKAEGAQYSGGSKMWEYYVRQIALADKSMLSAQVSVCLPGLYEYVIDRPQTRSTNWRENLDPRA